MKLKYKLPVLGIVLLVLCAALLPGWLLRWQQGKKLMQAREVPEKYYSSNHSALAKDASAKLTNDERLQLISGEWKSETSLANPEDMELTEAQAVAMARKKWGQGSLKDSDHYENWYSYIATPYQSIDAVFHTYTAYYWEIHFTKYDQSDSFTVRMLEDGTTF